MPMAEAEAAEQERAILGSDVELSASATVVHFDHPLPLLRGPVPAGPADDPSAGPFVLAFRDAETWRSAFRTTESKIVEQCVSGARVECSISASNNCKPPWWKSLFGLTAADFAEREQCEERELAYCLAASKGFCTQFAKEKCLPPFRDARIASVNLKTPLPVFGDTDSTKNVSHGKFVDSGPTIWHLEALQDPSSCSTEVTNYRGSILLEESPVEGSQVA